MFAAVCRRRGVYFTERIMLNPLCERLSSSCWQKDEEVAYVAEVCRHFAMPALIEAMGQHGPTFTGNPSDA